MQALNTVRLWRREEVTAGLLVAPAVLYVLVLFVIPVGYVLLLSVTDPTLSLEHYRRLLRVPVYASVMLNTFKVSLIVTITCLVLAYPLAYVMARRNDIVSLIFLVVVGMSFWTGFVVRTYAWLVILGSRGPVAALYSLAGWTKPPQLLFTSFSSTLGMVHILLPYMVLALYGVMRKIDPSYLRAAEGLGARPFGAFRHVFLPLSLPGIVNGSVLVFTLCLGFLRHADPAGHPQGHDDLAAHQSTDRGPAGVGVRVCDRGGSTCRHPRSARRLQSIRRPRSPMGLAFMQRHIPLIFANLVAIFLIGPMAIIVPMSFSTAISFEFPPPGYWLGYYAQFFSSAPWLNATLNSFIVAFGTMALTLLVALPAAFGLVRYRFRGKTGVNLLIMLPLVVPAVVSALAYYEFLSILNLAGTRAGLIIAHSALSIPVAFLVISASLKGFDRNLERAAMSAGAGPLRTFLWVTLPVMRPGILVGALFAFLHSFNEAVVALFIAGRDASTLPKKMFESIRLESDPVIAVVSTLLTGAVLAGLIVSIFFRRRPLNAS